MSIEVSQLTKIYGQQVAVNKLSFKVAPGEIVGFLGPNGAGKSTTMKMITGFLRPDEGYARICDTDVNENPVAVKKQIGYLPENNPLYTDLYVREYLGFIAELHQLKNKKEAVEQVIEKVVLTPEANKKIAQLSKGYKQRVGLAAALIHHPKVLILDEPTSGLDPNQILEIREVIKQEGKNKTVLFSSHIMQEVEAICDRVIIITKGNLVADSSMAELKSKGKDLESLFRELTNAHLELISS
jgi:ABC-2 type transport system ATP-binding protein